ncbi:hypothetical protein A2U01_0025804, partial [Trifolium medium]|nr:hypothetical protein [Trifolium medium]
MHSHKTNPIAPSPSTQRRPPHSPPHLLKSPRSSSSLGGVLVCGNTILKPLRWSPPSGVNSTVFSLRTKESR